jgi:ElaB/YqjD/DUF883 family membrane-anchored ribosome-binding protein
MTHSKSHASSRRNGILPRELSHNLDTLQDSFGRLKEDVVTLVQDAAGVGREGAGVIKDRAVSAFEEVGHKIDQLRDRGSQAVEDVESRIENNPLMAAGIAFGAGFILAKLWRHR